MRRTRRHRLGLSGALVSVVLAVSAASAQAQSLEPTVVRDPSSGTVTYDFRHSAAPRGANAYLGAKSPQVFIFDPLNTLNPFPPCQWLNPGFRNVVICPPINGFNFLLGPGANRVFVAPNLPALPGPNLIQGGANKDVVQGGQSDEKIKTGKGKDQVNAGPGKDDVNAGPGNDEIDTKDGEKDKVNGGKGRDEATVDRKDDVKNVEEVKPK